MFGDRASTLGDRVSVKRLAGLAVAAVCCLGLVYLSGSAEAQTAPGAPTVASVTAGAGSLTVTWTAPASDGGSPVTSYDLRHIETVATDRTDGDWTVEEGVWTSGDLSHTVAGLTDGVDYDVEVRAANATGPGAWSATASGTTRDHPDTQSAATTLVLDSSLPGRIDPGDDEDLFKIVLTEDTDLWVYTTGDLDTTGKLTDSRGDVLASNNQGRLPPRPRNFSLRAEVGPGTYYVSVLSNKGAHAGAYRIHTVAARPASNLNPTTVSLGSLTPGRMVLAGWVERFEVTVTEDTDLWVLSIGETATRGELYGAGGDLIVRADGSSLPGNSRGFTFRAQVEAGTYDIRVEGRGVHGGGPYILYVQAVGPRDSRDTAAPLTFDLAAPGRMDSAGDEDYFSLALAAPTNLILSTLPYAHSHAVPLTVTLVDGEGNETELYTVRSPPAPPARDRSAGVRSTARTRLGAGVHHFRVTSPDGDTGPYMLLPRVDVAAGDFEEECLARGSSQSDPLYGCQWHLNNTGQYGLGAGQDINVEGVWAATMGEGVNVAVVDAPVDLRHDDLKDNVRADRSHGYRPHTAPSEIHGTAVAGIIAAADNTVGVRGVAPRATLYSYGISGSTDGDRTNAMLLHASEVAVSSNSWGFADIGAVWFAPGAWVMAVERGVNEGYGGKGIFYTWAAGNGHNSGDNSNYDGRANHYAITAVCAVDYDDVRAHYSELGANLWVCAPSSGDTDLPRITTTGVGNGYTDNAGGTSAASPIVSGVAALLRAVNPDLTWRDLRLILAASARRNDPGNSGWEEGALEYRSDAERYRFNHEYGFGVVDAGAAAALADGWTSPPGWREVSATSSETVEIPDLGSASTSLTLDPYVDFVEFIAIEPTISHTFYRDLSMELTSPDGATSILAATKDVFAFGLISSASIG